MTTRVSDPGEIPKLARCAAAAFADDPLFAWLFPGEHRQAHLERFFRGVLGAYSPLRTALAIGSGADGFALWLSPEQQPRWYHYRPIVRAVAGLLLHRAVPAARLRPAYAALREQSRHHPKEPVFYLAVLAVHPSAQGQGYGRTLLGSLLDAADDAGGAIWLETSNPDNLGYYRRHGFEIVDTIQPYPQMPPFWTMRREGR
ncbi:MAG: N-acetyltransferase [Candidatus Dadabacteria bacterium]|nr:MAG: N-acetyltransferase [Candidatus Dadabacteria bacterium]